MLSHILFLSSINTSFHDGIEIGIFLRAKTPIYDCISFPAFPMGCPFWLNYTVILFPIIFRLTMRHIVTQPRLSNLSPALLTIVEDLLRRFNDNFDAVFFLSLCSP
ncbi:hypothetical protein RchiOBHm_Chr2g0141571 [Rosa chinensis]|uniref:Uncharacterized protein n=1 Tax=Rosa chinensis TaxID=74649 RepID=A0A2P6RXM4_ROSCH|nr:hypothetical protein RchiOBHm_Chr2g0141571 [Rosa chinensis]